MKKSSRRCHFAIYTINEHGQQVKLPEAETARRFQQVLDLQSSQQAAANQQQPKEKEQ
jgi:hypothetical protein